MRLSRLVACLKEKEIYYKGEEPDREIFSLCADSREMENDSLFFCLTGGKTDGHAYAKEAVQNGAVAIVAERKTDADVPHVLVKDTREALATLSANFYGDPTQTLKVIGITGTNGKTTTTHMLASILEAAGKKVGKIGTLGVSYEGKNYPAKLTTPDPISLQKTLADMFLRGVEYVVMEVSAHALYYKKTAGVRFVAGIFTNLTQDHLDFFENMETYESAKKRLFSPDICPLAVLNGDEAAGRKFGQLRGENTIKTKTVYYGLHTPADAFAVLTNETLQKSECVLNINDQLCRASIPLTGRHNVYNALAAAACAVELGVDISYVAKGLSSMQGVKGRLEKITKYNGADVFVDFAHTPDGLQKSLEALKGHCNNRLICLFGCGGNRDKEKRPIMGEIAAKKADFTILTSDNPRYEDPLDIITEIERGHRRFSMKYVVVPDRKKAMEYALDLVQEGDILLIAGKGGEEYQEVMGIKYSFNENDIIEKIIERKRKPFLL